MKQKAGGMRDPPGCQEDPVPWLFGVTRSALPTAGDPKRDGE